LRSGSRLELDHVPVGIAQVDRRAVPPRPETLDDVALERDTPGAKIVGDRLEVVALDRQAEVRGPYRALVGGGQEIDQGVAEAQVDQRDPLVVLGERAAQDVLVEPARARLVRDPQDDVIEAERLVHRHLRRGQDYHYSSPRLGRRGPSPAAGRGAALAF